MGNHELGLVAPSFLSRFNYSASTLATSAASCHYFARQVKFLSSNRRRLHYILPAGPVLPYCPVRMTKAAERPSPPLRAITGSQPLPFKVPGNHEKATEVETAHR